MKRVFGLRRSGFCALFVASLLGLLVACGPSGATANASTKPTKSVITFGNITDASGPLGAAVADGAPGVKGWAAWVNAHGGLNGHPVKVLYADTQGTPAGGLTAAEKLVSQDHVQAFIGVDTNVASQTIFPYANEQHVPIFQALVGAENSTPGVYAIGVDPATEGAIFAQTNKLLYKGATKIAVIYCQESPNCLTITNGLKAAAPKAGLQISYAGSASLSAPNYAAQVLAAKNSGAQTLLILMSTPAIVTITQEMAQQGWNPHILIPNTLNISSADTTPIPSNVTLTAITGGAVPWNVQNPNPHVSTYVHAVRQAAGSNAVLGDQGWLNWTFGMLLKQASSSLGNKVTSSDLTSSLVKLGRTDAGGLISPVTWSRPGGNNGGNKCVFLESFHAGTWTVPSVSKACAP